MGEKNWPVRVAGVVMSLVIFGGAVAALAAPGEEADPLVTLGYLTGQFTPKMEQRVEELVAANEAALADKLAAAIDAYAAQLGTQSAAGFQPVALTEGQTLSAPAGVEFILVSGTATATGNLMDTTAGATLYIGGALSAAHLYVAEGDGGVRATGAATVMVRGDYVLG